MRYPSQFFRPATAIKALIAAAVVGNPLAVVAQTQIGIGGIHADMSVDDIAAALGAQSLRVFFKSANYVEAVLRDPGNGGTVRVRFIFDKSSPSRLTSVEFVEDDDKAVRQYINWVAQLSSKYGNGAGREAAQDSVRDTYCHSKNLSIVLQLFEQRTFLAYFFNPKGSGNCQNAPAKRNFEALLYDFRPPAMVAAATTPETRTTVEPPKAARQLSSEPSSLSYAPHRGSEYQSTLRCIGVAAFNMTQSSDSGEKARWNGVIRTLSSKMVSLGRAEGLAPGQVDSESRPIVQRNVGIYQQSRREANGVFQIEQDQAFCRANGRLP